MRKIYIIGALACVFSSCKPSVNITTVPAAGSAVFTNYLAIGSSLTAGYADGSLYVTGQVNSYPQRLFEQFSLIQLHGAESNFYQPLLHSDNGFGPSPANPLVNGDPRLVLNYVPNCLGVNTLTPGASTTYSPDPMDAAAYVSPGPGGQVNNIGVPGLRVADYPVVGYGANNIFAARFYNNPATRPLDELKYRVANLHPTFFTCWMGTDDVYGYALAGGQGNGSGGALPAVLNYYSVNDITPTAVFTAMYDSIIQTAISTGAKGALMNIPDVASLPFFTAIPANGLYITRQTLADSLTAFYASKNYVFSLGANYFIIQDDAGVLRQAVPGELILLSTPLNNISCAPFWGSFSAIPKQYVLTTDEIQNIRTATAAYNAVIADEATRYNLALINMNTFLASWQAGMVYNGVSYSTQYISSSAYSLDGMSPTPRGYAEVTNQIITGINKQYGSTINNIDPNAYNGIMFP